ncbi:MAG: hypothetical protein Unbinned1693contig1002_52 [Prokaryotic dsDNA virus sp.]|jgi:hypothetical protein|nr:MAG: hypothetical protein Unbinned1693contig1002_52 [Prokaryotic dsDNA virus sp.]|tara:strand:+ start:24896 stop:26221 length:1326 start_codon:yes stop_codon:yes gene_type:complete
MAYASNLKFVQESGLGLRVIDENVGTGDGAETDFDLDYDNIISGGYTISYATSGSNDFTALIETTHYTLDKESGRIVLEAAGVSAIGTDIIYATYWYTDTFSDTVITNLLATADDEIDLLTGRKWDGPTSVIEYYSGRASSDYPTTDEPFQEDWNQSDFIVLNQTRVTIIDAIYFLSKPLSISNFFNYDDGGSDYTDKTDEVNSTTESPFTLFDDAPATNDFIYIGSSNVFLGLDVNLSTVGVDNGSTAIDWEYYNGSSWVDLTETDDVTGTSIFTVSGKFTWTYPYGWAQNSVNSETNYWIRGKLTDDYSVDPICATMTILDSVNQVLEPRNWLVRSSGVLKFINKDIPNGANNIRVDYNYGQATTPTYIAELSVLKASVKAFVNLSGGSYDDATSYTLGSKSVTIGEVYVNIREVLNQFKARIKEILDMVGRRTDVLAI